VPQTCILTGIQGEGHAVPTPECGAGAGALYPSPRPLNDDHPLKLAQAEDLQALGLAILETVFCALADGCPSDKTCGDALSRLLIEIYEKDTKAFRCSPRHTRSSPRGSLTSKLPLPCAV
jgi:hypothetical protein